MKLYSLFDRIDDSFGIEDRVGLSAPCNISSDRITAMTHKKLGIAAPKRRSGRKLIVLLAAAVLVVCTALGVSAVIANRTADSVFSDVFSGEPNALGLFESRSVDFSSPDKNLSASVLGMTADYHDLYAMLSVRHEDGTPFTDEDYRYGLYIPTSGTFDDFGGMISCTMKNGEPLGNLGFGGGFDCHLYLSDDRTELKIYLRVDLNGLDAQDGKLTFTSRRFRAQKITEILRSYETVTNRDWLENEKLIDSEGWHFIRTDDNYVLCKTIEKEYELPFEISFSLDYETGNNIWLHPSRTEITDILTPAASGMTAVFSDLGIELASDCSASAAGIGMPETGETGLKFFAFREINSADSYITLDNGTSYYLVLSGFSSGINDSTGRYEESIHLRYRDVPDPALADEIIVVDKRNISRIVINGDTVYEKGGYENVAQVNAP